MVDIASTVKKPPSKLEPKQPQLSILDQIRLDRNYTQSRSVDWFKKKIQDAGGNSPSAKNDLFKTTKENQVTRVLPGSMYIFKYDAKHKETLPYWDSFPCSLMFDLKEDGFIGLNLHYAPYVMRAKLMDKLLQFANTKNTKEQILKLNWKFLSNVSKYPEVRPLIKRYLYSQVRSKLIRVPVDEWKIAVMLPVESFNKKSLSYITRATSQQVQRIIKR